MSTVDVNPPRIRHSRVDLADIVGDDACHVFVAGRRGHTLCGIPTAETLPHGDIGGPFAADDFPRVCPEHDHAVCERCLQIMGAK